MGKTIAATPISEVQQGYFDTWNVGGDRFDFYPSSMFAPNMYVGDTQSSTLALLSVPPTYDQIPIGGMGQSVTKPGTIGASAPFSPKLSLLPWVIVGLIVGYWGIHHLYYRERKGERKEA